MCFIQLAGNDLCHAKQALKEGVGIKNVEIGQLLRRQPWASSVSDNADVLNVNRQLKAKAEKGMESIYGHIVVIGRT